MIPFGIFDGVNYIMEGTTAPYILILLRDLCGRGHVLLRSFCGNANSHGPRAPRQPNLPDLGTTSVLRISWTFATCLQIRFEHSGPAGVS